MTMIRTLARHAVAALMAFLAGWITPILTDIGYSPDQVAEALSTIEAAAFTAIMIAVYFVTEKLLKPIFTRFGERQVEEIDPKYIT